MPITLTQDNRLGRLDTPLGKDELCLVRFNATEGASELFEIAIEAVSTKPDIDFDKAIGQNCSLTIQSYAKPDRYFNGILVAAQGLGGEGELYNYRLVLRPWLWLLSRTSDCRIFENQTATAIIKQVFKDRGFSDFQDATNGNFPELDYCVQYRETDLAFVSRLMEQHGIYFFFKHTQDKHKLVLADGKSAHEPVPGHASIPVFLAGLQDRRDQEYLHHWSPQRRFRSGKFELTDYNYLTPDADLKGQEEGSAAYTKSKMEIFDYPGKYKTKSDGETYVKYRLEAEQAQDQRRAAKGNAISLFPGGLTKLEKHPSAFENKQYLILRAAHSYTAESYFSAMAGEEPSYSGDYEFLASDIPYRAPMTTPRPLVHGPQTAKVVADKNNDGEEIDVDEHGRILVRFFWDREKKRSCRVRVAQVWAGKGWGGQVIPRIGQEVVVEFLEGDPDRPLVTGTVYNDMYKHPFAMPDNKTQSGLKSSTTKGGSGYNELMFEDKKDSEKINLHAQKDLELAVLNSETRTVGEKFKSPTGSPSRKTTLEHGDDVLDVATGAILTSAKMKIELKVGPSKITIDPTGITLDAPTITIKAKTTCIIEGLPVKIN